MSDYIERNCAKCNSLLHHEDKCPSPCNGGAGDHCGKGDCLKCDHVETLGKLWDASLLLRRAQPLLENSDAPGLLEDIKKFMSNRYARR